MKYSKRFFIAFDLDYTILNNTCDFYLERLLPAFNNSHFDGSDWYKYMNKVFADLHKNKVTINDIKAKIMEIELNPGFRELINYIKSNKNDIDSIIISGANTLFIQWIIEKHEFNGLFDAFISNQGIINSENIIEIKPSHSHSCKLCVPGQCKSILLKDYLQEINIEYHNKFYIGDGDNDFCPSLLLGKDDVLFPRKNFPLDHLVIKNSNLLKCSVLPWKNGFTILDKLRELNEKI